MRSIKTILCSLLLMAGAAMVVSEGDKKDDKKDDEKKGHEPVLIIIWENTWKPIYRAIPLQDAMTSLQIENEE